MFFYLIILTYMKPFFFTKYKFNYGFKTNLYNDNLADYMILKILLIKIETQFNPNCWIPVELEKSQQFFEPMQSLFGQEMIQKQQLFYRYPFGQRLLLCKTTKECTEKILKVGTILNLNHYFIGISMIYSNTTKFLP